jgi:hypothetical protein
MTKARWITIVLALAAAVLATMGMLQHPDNPLVLSGHQLATTDVRGGPGRAAGRP